MRSLYLDSTERTAAEGLTRRGPPTTVALQEGANIMIKDMPGGAVFTARDVTPSEYLPNKGVWLAGMLGKARGDGIGLYFGRIDPGSAIARETHADTSETVYILAG